MLLTPDRINPKNEFGFFISSWFKHLIYVSYSIFICHAFNSFLICNVYVDTQASLEQKKALSLVRYFIHAMETVQLSWVEWNWVQFSLYALLNFAHSSSCTYIHTYIHRKSVLALYRGLNVSLSITIVYTFWCAPCWEHGMLYGSICIVASSTTQWW